MWKVSPPRSRVAAYYMAGTLVYRDMGHPDGPSSVPSYRRRCKRLFPATGHPLGESTTAHFLLELTPLSSGTRVRQNAEAEDPDL